MNKTATGSAGHAFQGTVCSSRLAASPVMPAVPAEPVVPVVPAEPVVPAMYAWALIVHTALDAPVQKSMPISPGVSVC